MGVRRKRQWRHSRATFVRGVVWPAGIRGQRCTAPGRREETAERLGLFDMLGNVAEWCEDWFSPNYQRVVRGGAWTDGATSLRFSARGKAVPTTRTYSIGIRVVRTPAGS